MREILFRGKRIDGGEWVEGHYHFSNWYLPPSMEIVDTTHYILQIGNGDADKIDPQTVCQYCGLADKNAKKIFEGDIIKNEYEENKYQYFKVFYNEKKLQWEVMNKYGMRGILANVIGKMEVIGNIFDNPDLLR